MGRCVLCAGKYGNANICTIKMYHNITYCITKYYNTHMNPTYPVLITVEPDVIKLLKHKNTLMYFCNFNLNKSDTYCFIDCNLGAMLKATTQILS
jgi:hypothetical protein